jgi:hypothetical protein
MKRMVAHPRDPEGGGILWIWNHFQSIRWSIWSMRCHELLHEQFISFSRGVVVHISAADAPGRLGGRCQALYHTSFLSTGRCTSGCCQVAAKASNWFGDQNEKPSIADGDAEAAAGGGRLTESQIDALDAVMLRKYLAAFGLPASGKVSKLRERLKEYVGRTG